MALPWPAALGGPLADADASSESSCKEHSLGGGWQRLAGSQGSRRVTVLVTWVCLSLTERKAEEAEAAGPQRGLQGHR